MKSVIEAKGVSKVFKLYNRSIDRFKETLLPFDHQVRHSPFHALDDINFHINKGETVGIVGRNGSGKSTLLQIICGIVQPTAGQVTVDGRISALLELGAGFNPEFTGRENVYLNGSILGMSQEEMDEHFDDILSFSEIGSFIDQPVKTYSSGMYVRLAFSVAINVHPDILIVDEALSVGDTLFQAKCFAKFREFQEKGVTILFVTHSDDLITRYCSSALLLDHGRQIMFSSSKTVVDEYRRILSGISGKNTPMGGAVDARKDSSQEEFDKLKGYEISLTINTEENRYGNGDAQITDFGVRSIEAYPSESFVFGEKYLFWITIKFNKQKKNPIVAFAIKDIKGLEITGTNTWYKNVETGIVAEGETIAVSFEHTLLLNPGQYLLSFGCSGFEEGELVVYDRRYDLIAFQVISSQQTFGLFDLDSEIKVIRLKK